MVTFTKLKSGKVRAQIRLHGIYRGATFPTKREAKKWASTIEAQAISIAASGVAMPPKGATLADLIDKYSMTAAIGAEKTKKLLLRCLRIS